MNQVEADALLKAFLAAKKAGQEELWRAAHPEAPDGPTVLIIWLMVFRDSFYRIDHKHALRMVVDNKCKLRIAIYAALAAYPSWDNLGGARHGIKYRHGGVLGAIRAAIAYYCDPTDKKQRAAAKAANRAYDACNLARADHVTEAAHAAHAAWNAASIAYYMDSRTESIVHHAVDAVDAAGAVIGTEAVVDVIIAAIADHYEGRPLEMP